MCTTRGKWVMNMLWSFDFRVGNIEKHLSSLTLPIICTMANSINFTNSRKLQTSIRNVITKCYTLVKGLVSKSGAMQYATTFDFIVNLNMPCQLSRSLTLRTSYTKVSTPSNNWVLLKQKVVLITSKCFGKDASQSGCS